MRKIAAILAVPLWVVLATMTTIVVGLPWLVAVAAGQPDPLAHVP